MFFVILFLLEMGQGDTVYRGNYWTIGVKNGVCFGLLFIFKKKLKPLNSLHLHQNFWTYVVHSLIQYRLCSGKPPLEKKYVTKMLFVSNEYEMW